MYSTFLSKQLKREGFKKLKRRIWFGLEFEGTVRHGREVTVLGNKAACHPAASVINSSVEMKASFLLFIQPMTQAIVDATYVLGGYSTFTSS